VLVVDFGLARADAPALGSARSFTDSLPLASPTLSRPGSRLGTPGYMAPEQIRGERADARSDQFSFAVAAWEALYGEHPFGTKKWPALAIAVVDGDVHAPADPADIPPAVEKTLRRALRPLPEDRFPSFEVFLSELQRAAWPARRRRALMVGVGAIALALAGASTVGYVIGSDDTPEGCERNVDTLVAEVWNDQKRDGLTGRFAVEGQPHVAATWTYVEGRVDRWIERWRAARTLACSTDAKSDDAARVRQMRRVACLDRALGTVGGLGAAMAELDPLAFANGDATVAAALGDLSECTSDEAIARRLPEPDNDAEEVRAILDQVARAHVLTMAGNRDGAAAVLEPLRARAEAVDYPPLRSEVGLGLALVAGDDAALEVVALDAERTGNDRVLGYALAVLFALADDDAEAEHRLARAQAAQQRAGSPLGLQRIVVSKQLERAIARNELEQALELEDGYRALVLADDGAGTPEHAWGLRLRGVILLKRGRYAVAKEQLEEALEIYDATLGPHHPERAWVLGALAEVQEGQGDPNAAEATDAIIIDLLRRAHPDEPMPLLAEALYRQAIRRFESGRAYSLAIEFAAEVVQEMEQALGPRHPKTQMLRYDLARIRVATGAVDDALADIEQLLVEPETIDSERKRLDVFGMRALSRARSGDEAGAASDLEHAKAVAGEDAALTAQWLEWSADVAEAQGWIVDALRLAEDALRRWEVAQAEHVERSRNRARTRVGRLRLEAGMAASAAAPLQQVLAEATTAAGPRWPFLPDAEFALAKVMRIAGDDLAAHDLGRRAYDGYGDLGKGRAGDRDAVSAWLAAYQSVGD
jgi:tetratricopeptide (TPR) repeat protein